MKKLSPREKIILFVTVALAVIFIIYLLVLRPMHEGSIDINDQLRQDQDKLVKATQMVAQKGLVDAHYQNLVDVIGMVDSDEAQMPTIISKIESAARDHNIHIGNIQPQRTAAQKNASFLAVEVEMDGQWVDIVSFLSALQQAPNFYFVDELNLEKYTDASNSLRGRVVISRMALIAP